MSHAFCYQELEKARVSALIDMMIISVMDGNNDFPVGRLAAKRIRLVVELALGVLPASTQHK